MQRYKSFHDYFYNLYDEKILKLSIDGGFTCPNRDGKCGYGGCIFCSEKGSGDFNQDQKLSVTDQMRLEREKLSKKWPRGLNLAYFQNYTGTYKETDQLRKLYYEALGFPKTIGLAIATRADSISDSCLKLLEEINKKTFLFIELGMQTVNEDTIKTINRGYSHKELDQMLDRLKKSGIRTLLHIIAGLPGEGEEDFLKAIDYANKKEVFGVKFHSLFIQEDSRIKNLYFQEKLKPLEKEEYINLVVKAISRLDKNIVIHRLTGDPDREKLIAPVWVKNKLGVISSIEKALKEKDIVQGDCKL